MTEEEFTAQRRALTVALIAALTQLWYSLGSWRSADIARFVEQAVPLLRGAQVVLAEMTTIFMATQASDRLGRPVDPPSIPEDRVTDLRNGVSDTESLSRPFKDTWKSIAEGDDLEAAVEKGRARLVGLTEFEMQETYAHASREAMSRFPAPDRPRWWRRVPQGPVTCALCWIASTRAYSVEELNPIHPGCDCRVDPQYTNPPGIVADPDTLQVIEKAVADELGREGVTDAETLRDLFIDVTDEHAELGRILAYPRKPRR